MVNKDKTRQIQKQTSHPIVKRVLNIQTVLTQLWFIVIKRSCFTCSNEHQSFQFGCPEHKLKTCRTERKRERETDGGMRWDSTDKLQQSVCRSVGEGSCRIFLLRVFLSGSSGPGATHTHLTSAGRSGAADGLKMKMMMKSSRITGVTPLVVLFLLHATRAGTFTHSSVPSEIIFIWKMNVIVLSAWDSWGVS